MLRKKVLIFFPKTAFIKDIISQIVVKRTISFLEK